jgi:hypothetical protein
MAEKETRVGLYAGLRDQIEKMDTLSFDDPDRDSKYGLKQKKAEDPDPDALSDEDLRNPHIKKNTLSLSIDDLIKQNDDYTLAMERKELDKKFKEVKKKQRQENRGKTIIVWSCVALGVLIIVAVILICLHFGGKL